MSETSKTSRKSLIFSCRHRTIQKNAPRGGMEGHSLPGNLFDARPAKLPPPPKCNEGTSGGASPPKETIDHEKAERIEKIYDTRKT